MLAIGSKNVLGVMTCEKKNASVPFSEQSFFRKLSLYGERAGLTVIVFTPTSIQWDIQRVTGYLYDRVERKWRKQMRPLPSLIYDRCFYSSREQFQKYVPHLRKLRRRSSVHFLGNSLKGKWDIYNTLKKHEKIRPFLPKTELYTDPAALHHWLDEHGEVFIKPSSGSQGKGTAHIKVCSDCSIHVCGRTLKNEPFTKTFTQQQELSSWASRFTARRTFLLQQYLNLQCADGSVYDMRSLVQKNAKGQWTMTGSAIRNGKAGSVTSNLHGGGTAKDTEVFLTELFSQQQVEHMLNSLNDLSKWIPEHLETYHGRLVELGIDFGIDSSGQIWVIEVNSKPGRSIFKHTRNKDAAIQSVQNPVYYARYLLDRHLGGYN